MAKKAPGNKLPAGRKGRTGDQEPRHKHPDPFGANAEPAGASGSAMEGVVAPLSETLQDSVDAANGPAAGADHGWVVRLVEREGWAILRLLWRLLGNEPDVMDAYQDCFCKLAGRSGKVDLACAKAYAYRTATNIAIEMIRVRRRRGAHWPAVVQEYAREQARRCEHASDRTEPTVRSEEVDRSNGPVGPEAFERLRAAITQLPPHLSNVIVLRDLGRLSYNEVGRTLGIEPTTARVYRRHAVVQLAELLDEGEVS